MGKVYKKFFKAFIHFTQGLEHAAVEHVHPEMEAQGEGFQLCIWVHLLIARNW